MSIGPDRNEHRPSRQRFVIAYSWQFLNEFRNLPYEVADHAATVIIKLAQGRIQGAPLPAMLNKELADVHRVGLHYQGAMMYKFHPAQPGSGQFPTAHLLSIGADDQQLRDKTIERVRVPEGRLWNVAYTRDFLTVDLAALRDHPDLRDGLWHAVRTLVSPNPPRGFDPIDTTSDLHLNLPRGQKVRQVPFSTAEARAIGAPPQGVLTWRVLTPSKAKSNTVLLVSATPTNAADTERMIQQRLRMIDSRDQQPRAYSFNSISRQRADAPGLAEAGETAGPSPSPTPSGERASAARRQSTTGSGPKGPTQQTGAASKSAAPRDRTDEATRHR